MFKKSILCSILFALSVNIILADNLKLHKTEILLEPSSKPAVVRDINYNAPEPSGRFLDTLYYDDGTPDYPTKQAVGVRSGGGWNWSVNPGLYGDLMLRAIVSYLNEPDIECSPNPLYISAKQYCYSPEFTFRSYPEKIDRELKEKMEESSTDELLPVIIEFDKLITPDFLYNRVKGMDKGERRTFTINTLKAFSSSYQKDIMKYLKWMENSGKVEQLRELWLTNSIGIKATKEVVNRIAEYQKVAIIWLDNQPTESFIENSQGIGNNVSRSLRDIVWNIQKINANDVWPLGYSGQNIIIGHISPGVRYTHWDLKDHLWDGTPLYPHHGWDFVDFDDDPWDSAAGTFTAGIFAGDGTAGTTTGVAPDPLIMILRTIPGTLSDIQAAINFALTNGAHLITMSAGWDSSSAGGSWNYLSSQMRYSLDNCLNAGVVFSTSAGNGNSMGGHYEVPYDIDIPANVPPPWYGMAGHSACMAVGATNQDNSIASFSSYGPTQWWFSPWYEYQYPPGLIKPDVSAPGGSPGITSCSPYNDSGYVSGWQGTSCSCPHLAGLIALMLSKNPNLTPEELDSIIEETCLDLGAAGRDNFYGTGLINALDAVNAVTTDATTSGDFYCKNLGADTLDVINIWKSATWITSITPTSFTVLPGDSQGVTVNINTSGLEPDTYYDTLWLYSNDPDENPYGEVVILNVTGIEEKQGINRAPYIRTLRCYPNPTGNRTTITFTLPHKEKISIFLYDVTGRKVSTVVNGRFESGIHNIVWNRENVKGKQRPQGIYFILLKSHKIEAREKLILID